MELNYRKFEKMFPEIASGKYRYLRMEAGEGMMPLHLEIDTDVITVSHTYMQDGDVMYDPEITSQNQLLAMLKQQGGVDPDIFISRSNELAEQLRAVKLEKERLLNACRDDTITQTQALIDTIEAGPDFLEQFDGELFGELVDKIIVESNERLRFRLKNGLELTESIEGTVR